MLLFKGATKQMDASKPMFKVELTIIVDRPELRDTSYPKVPAGQHIPTAWDYKTQKSAVTMFDSICRGEWDFGSEFVSKVRVLAFRDNSSPRVVRQWRLRSRAAAQGNDAAPSLQ